MAWILLMIAGIFEVVWATTMKLSHGFTQPGWAIATVVEMIISFAGLIMATKHLPISLAYPIWTGIGAVGSVIVGNVWFHDQLSPITWAFVALLIISIIGIKLTSAH